ncbi:MAG TPA: hypothetical protein VLG13_02050 [Patescibacteria group bacterium]|nr:hypothetical protein [Patescibacteria group bacterium]
MRYFVGFLISIGLIILLIVLLFHHGPSKVPVTKQPLISYANTDTEVRLTIDGPVNAPQNHNSIRITIGQNDTTYQQIQGYDGNSVNTQTFAMTESAYDVFLHALQHAGYTLGNDDKNLKDERGYCPLGNRYIFEIIQNGSDLERYWTTNCSSTPSTFKGRASIILSLFKAQVPGYDELVSDVQL